MRGQKNYAVIPELVQQANFPLQLNAILDHLVTAGISQFAYYDHSRADFNLPVVHVVIPGMRGLR